MKITIRKVLNRVGKALMFVLIAAGVLLLLAERFQENSFVNFIRSLM
ncbi:hypothetical protein [Dyella flagellata]|nr:hypothetical protein [Dyella flagellata]